MPTFDSHGLPLFAEPHRKISLAFRDHDDLELLDEPVTSDLSASVLTGACLWVAHDERAHLERLWLLPDGGFGYHQPFELTDFFSLPEGNDEIDIEAMDADDGYLWIAGSHSKTRKKPKNDKKPMVKALKRLAELKDNPNRSFLAKVPLVPEQSNGYTLAKSHTDDKGRERRCGLVPMSQKHGSELRKLLSEDPLLGPFMALPAKENGFDIEGLCVREGRVFLGLRGPVIRGYAVVIELHVNDIDADEISFVGLNREDRPYSLHLVALDGLGIRDCRFIGDDLLLLAGPTADVSGPVRLFRWHDALRVMQTHIVDRSHVDYVLEVPHGHGEEHAEGIFLEGSMRGRDRVLEDDEVGIVYDGPAEGRLAHDGRIVTADVFRF